MTVIAGDVEVLRKQIDRFLKQKEGHVQKETLNLYRGALYRTFLPWCASNGVEEAKDAVDRVMDKFKAHLSADGKLSADTVHTYIRYVRIFLRANDVPTGTFKPPRRQARFIEPLGKSDVDAMLRVAELENPERDQLIVRALWETGLQIGELLNLTGDDLIQEQQRTYLRIQQHGRGRTRTRLVPVVRAELFDSLKRLARTDPGYIFKDESGGQLTRNAAGRIIHELAVKARLRRRSRSSNGRSGVSPQLFRQSFATRWLENRGNPIDLMHVLGLNNLHMITNVYARLSKHDEYAEMLRLKEIGAL